MGPEILFSFLFRCFLGTRKKGKMICSEPYGKGKYTLVYNRELGFIALPCFKFNIADSIALEFLLFLS